MLAGRIIFYEVLLPSLEWWVLKVRHFSILSEWTTYKLRFLNDKLFIFVLTSMLSSEFCNCSQDFQFYWNFSSQLFGQHHKMARFLIQHSTLHKRLMTLDEYIFFNQIKRNTLSFSTHYFWTLNIYIQRVKRISLEWTHIW